MFIVCYGAAAIWEDEVVLIVPFWGKGGGGGGVWEGCSNSDGGPAS